MLKICFFEDGNKIGMVMQGHANSAPEGEDLICAAASMMAYTAGQTATNLYYAGKLADVPTITLNKGEACIRMTPKPEHREDIRICMDVVKAGCMVLSENFGKFVQVINVGNSES